MHLTDYLAIRKNYDGDTILFVDTYFIQSLGQEIPISEDKSTRESPKISIEDLTNLRAVLDVVIEEHKNTLPNMVTIATPKDAFAKMREAMKVGHGG